MANIKQISTGGTTYDLSAKSLYQAGGRIATLNTAHSADDYGKMYHLIATSAANDSGVKPKFSPDGATPVVGDGYVLDFHWDSSAHWNTQLALKNSANPALSIRSDSNNAWSDWFPVLTSKNVVTGDNNGQIKFGGTNVSVKGLGSRAFDSTAYLPLAGGTMTGQISKAGVSKSWCNGRDGALVRMTSINGYSPTTSSKTANGSWEYGVWNNNTAYFTYITDSNYSSNTNTITRQYVLLPDGGSSWALRNISYGTGAPSGGSDGDVYIRYL